MDFRIFDLLNDFTFRHEWLQEILRFFANDGPILFVVLLAVLFLARGEHRPPTGRHAAVAAGLSATLALLVAQVIAAAWDRQRPYEAHPGDAHLLLSASPDPSFPSDHATAAFAIAVAIGLRHRTAGVVAFVLALLVSLSRVALGTHYPSDIAGGAALGAIVALVLWSPPVRAPLHRLADWLGDVYESLVPMRRRRA